MKPTTQRNILLVIILLLGFFGFIMMDRARSLGTKLDVSEQNNKALADSVRVEKNKYGEVVAAKNVLVSKRKELEVLNSQLGTELKRTKGKVKELNVVIARLGKSIHDTVIITNELKTYGNGKYGLYWSYDTTFNENNARHFAGTSEFLLDSNFNITPLTTRITKDITEFNLTTGLREKDGNIEIFATSQYPGFEVVKLDGAIINVDDHPVLKKFTKPKKWGVGPYIGIGFDGNLNSSIQVGVGINYSSFRF